MKKIVLSAVAVILALAIAGCSFSTTVTKTETVTDANGNTTTRTSTTTNDNGNVTTSETVEVIPATEATEAQSEKIVATIAFENKSGVLIYGLFFSSALNDNWGGNILEGGGEPLADGYTATCDNALTYSADDVIWDLRFADSDANTVDFKGLDLSKAADSHNITIVLKYNAEENAYYAEVK